MSAPLNVPPSLYWDGNDGPWSTFRMLAGTPQQNLRLLPATSSEEVMVVLADVCANSNNTQQCEDERGATFNPNVSSSWAQSGTFRLPLPAERPLGYSANARAGFDKLTLGWPGDGLPTLARQVIAGIVSTDFHLGSLGLTPRPVNISDMNDPQPSMLRTLRDEGKIPSASWAYTAGAHNHQPRVFGSLVLGGYDAARLVPNNVTFPFGPDTSRDLLVAVRSITTDASSSSGRGDSSLLPTGGIFAFINSHVPHIWLPVEACRAFESAFGLVWDNRTQLYLVNSTRHSALVQLNANVTFRLAPSLSSGGTVDIVMPYASFDLNLNASAPRVRSPTKYFPLRRAANQDQYTLGRAFLQNAYVIADYDRGNFSVSQALLPDIVAQRLVAIRPPNASDAASKKLSAGAIGGIVAGVALLLALATGALVVWVLRRRRRNRRAAFAAAGSAVADVAAVAAADAAARKEEAERQALEKPELDSANPVMAHLVDGTQKMELSAGETVHESNPWLQQLPSDEEAAMKRRDMLNAVHEMPGEDVMPAELEGELTYYLPEKS